MSKHLDITDLAVEIAEQVKKACIEAALRGFEDAEISGLCGEGALENAIGAIKMVNESQIASVLLASKTSNHDREKN